MSAEMIFGLWLLMWMTGLALGVAILAAIVPVAADYFWKINLIKKRKQDYK